MLTTILCVIAVVVVMVGYGFVQAWMNDRS